MNSSCLCDRGQALFTSVSLGLGFPGGASGKEPVWQCRLKRHRCDPWVRKIPLEEGMATHSNILAWRMPETEDPGRVQSIGLQRVRYDWSSLAYTHASLGFLSLCNGENNSVYIKGFLWEISETEFAKYMHKAWHTVSAQFSSVRPLCRVQLFVTPWTAAH